MKARFSANLKAAVDEPIVVTRHAKPVAVWLSVEDEEELVRLVMAYTPRFQAVLTAARQQIGETGGIGQEEFWREVEAHTP